MRKVGLATSKWLLSKQTLALPRELLHFGGKRRVRLHQLQEVRLRQHLHTVNDKTEIREHTSKRRQSHCDERYHEEAGGAGTDRGTARRARNQRALACSMEDRKKVKHQDSQN